MKIPFIKGKVSADKAFDTIATGIDKLAFTNEERAELNKLLADKVAEFAKDTLSENTIRSKTRRYAAISIITVYLLLLITLAAISFTDMQNPVLNKLVIDSPLTTGFIMVLAFFFGGYYIKGISLKGNKNK